MRIVLFIAAGLSALNAGSALAAAGTDNPGRRVQLISMTSVSRPEPSEAREEANEPEGAQPGAVISTPAFRVHDLSRRWVEFEMANDFASLRREENLDDPEDPFAHVGVAQPSITPIASGPTSALSLSVPLWMRGGAVFAAAASRYVPGCSLPAYRPAGFLRADAEYRRATYYGLMSGIACEYGIPVGLFDAMIMEESRYRPEAYSPKNAFGLTQLMPGTAQGLGVNRYDIQQNLRGGARYLRQQLDSFGHYHLALAAYNAGPGRIRNGAMPQIPTTRAYVDNILFNWSRLSGMSRKSTVILPSQPYPERPAAYAGRSAVVSTF